MSNKRKTIGRKELSEAFQIAIEDPARLGTLVASMPMGIGVATMYVVENEIAKVLFGETDDTDETGETSEGMRDREITRDEIFSYLKTGRHDVYCAILKSKEWKTWVHKLNDWTMDEIKELINSEEPIVHFYVVYDED